LYIIFFLHVFLYSLIFNSFTKLCSTDDWFCDFIENYETNRFLCLVI
jgi:hypothetical protein